MSGNCSVCSTKGTSRNTISCSECGKLCHLSCVNMTKEELDFIRTEKQIWRCPPCSKSRRQSMRAVSEAEEGKASISHVVFMLEEAKEDRKRMEKEMNNSFEFLHKLVQEQKEALNDQTEKLKEYMQLIDDLKKENLSLTKKVKELETKIDNTEQYSRLKNIEIHNVPEKANEDVYEVVTSVAAALGVTVAREAIDVCHRLSRRSDYPGPPAIIARFVRQEDKEIILQKRRVKRNFNTSDLGSTEPAVPVYINENLCPGRRKVFAAARQAKKEKNYTYLWIRNGKILMRKEPSSPVKVIASIDDIDAL